MSNYGDQFMTCPQCGCLAESEAVDVGVGLYIKGDYHCYRCNWIADGPDDHGFLTVDDVPTLPLEAYAEE